MCPDPRSIDQTVRQSPRIGISRDEFSLKPRQLLPMEEQTICGLQLNLIMKFGPEKLFNMATIRLKICVSCAAAALMFLPALSTASAEDSRPYLPAVGPTQLRFERQMAFKPLLLPPLSMENSTSSDNTPEKTDPTMLPSGFASGLNGIPARFFLPTTLWLNHLSGHGDTDPTATADIYTAASNPPTQSTDQVQPAPASDLLNVTPQMLVEYFKPGEHRGRDANPSVYVPVDFKPATPTVTPPSSATYNTSP